MIKLNVRGSTIQYATTKKTGTDKYMKSLTNDINVLDLECKENPNDDNLRSKLKEKEQISEHIYEERARSIYVRSQAQWVEDGEKSNKVFFFSCFVLFCFALFLFCFVLFCFLFFCFVLFSLEKNCSEKKVIQKLIVDGEEIHFNFGQNLKKKTLFQRNFSMRFGSN